MDRMFSEGRCSCSGRCRLWRNQPKEIPDGMAEEISVDGMAEEISVGGMAEEIVLKLKLRSRWKQR